jgi:hypothetical protein
MRTSTSPPLPRCVGRPVHLSGGGIPAKSTAASASSLPPVGVVRVTVTISDALPFVYRNNIEPYK